MSSDQISHAIPIVQSMFIPQKEFPDPYECIKIRGNGLNLSTDMTVIDLSRKNGNKNLAETVTTNQKDTSNAVDMTAISNSTSLDTGICNCSISNTSGSYRCENGDNLAHISVPLSHSVFDPPPYPLLSSQSNQQSTQRLCHASSYFSNLQPTMLSNVLPNPPPNQPCAASQSQATHFPESLPAESFLNRTHDTCPRTPCAILAAEQSPALSNFVRSCCSTITRKRTEQAADTDMDDAISIFAPSLG